VSPLPYSTIIKLYTEFKIMAAASRGETSPQLIVLSIGVSDYSALEKDGYQSIISSSFDSTLVANKFHQQGFTKKLLINPALEEVT
jgi:hypothetical protein